MSSQQLPWLVRKPAILITLGATAAAAFVFLMWPEIDLAVAVAMHRLHADAALRACSSSPRFSFFSADRCGLTGCARCSSSSPRSRSGRA
jgi:hypothetical protein